MTLHKSRLGKVLIGTTVVAVLGVGLGALVLSRGPAPRAQASPAHGGDQVKSEAVTVKVVYPQVGGMDRTTTQPGTVRAFEYEEMFARVTGYLQNQKVDRGSKVKKGQILATIHAPELLQEELHAAAGVKQAQAQVQQMKAHVAAARADLETAKILIEQKRAEVKRAVANLNFRSKAYERVQALVDYKAVDQRLVDEQFQQFESAQAWRDAAQVGVRTAIADVEAKSAKVAQAEADLATAEATVEVANCTLNKAREFVEFTRIRSHYDGVVTVRNYHDGDYIRPPDKGAGLPLLVVQRTDLMRVIVQVPDQDAGAFCDEGDPADLMIKSLADVKFPPYKIARIANSQDQGSRTMRVELDVPNEKNLLRDGMYGQVTIHLQDAAKDALRIPASALDRHEGKTRVFVVRDDLIHQVPVRVGGDTGAQIEILSGLKSDDLVVVQPNQQLHEGRQVRAIVSE